jgi:trimethylamine--corrinoid protein Co-methyltransferase
MTSDPDLELIHSASLRLLREVGVAFQSEAARALLRTHGAEVLGDRIRLTAGLVEQAVRSAPSDFTIAGRREDAGVHVGREAAPVLAGPFGPVFILDGGRQRPGTLDDLRAAIRLGHVSTNISVQGMYIEPTDVDDERRARVAAHAYVTGSDKPGFFSVTSLRELEVAEDVQEIVHGSAWHARPRLLTNVNTTSPLQFSRDAAEVVMRLAELGQPVLVSACAMGGTTAPLTLAGLLAVQHAELLAGLVLTQLAGPGCPFLYGGTSSVASMQTGVLMMGAPEYWALMDATVRLGHLLDLPVRAGGALTDAHVPDAQAGIESALALDVVLRQNVQFVLHAAGILSSFNCYSPEKFVIDDELISCLRLARRPILVDDDTLALDVMAAVGPGGSTLGTRHTRLHSRREARASLMNRRLFHQWEGDGGLDLAHVASLAVAERLRAYEPPDDLDPLTRRQLDRYCLA